MRTIALMTLLSAFLVGGQLAFKKAIASVDHGFSLAKLAHLLLQAPLWIAGLCIASAVVIWGYVLSYESLSRVYPMISISYVLMAASAYFWLGEPYTAAKLAGTALIVGGTILLCS
jgi:drug/metabolite transporter (DMT)-like permease